jgi:hypothetical protein
VFWNVRPAVSRLGNVYRCGTAIAANATRFLVDVGTVPGIPNELATGEPALDRLLRNR